MLTEVYHNNIKCLFFRESSAEEIILDCISII